MEQEDELETKRVIENDLEIYKPSFYRTLATVLAYIKSDITKHSRSFKIGVFTIFMVVSFIMMLKSLVDIAPIAFLKVG